jgi:hypothetical protein
MMWYLTASQIVLFALMLFFLKSASNNGDGAGAGGITTGT